MLDIFKEYLFHHGILVAEEKEEKKNQFAIQFLLAKFYGIHITEGAELLCKEHVSFIASELGEDVPEPFYRGFPESVKKLTTEQLLFDQIVHYTTTYGFGMFDRAGHSIIEDYIQREAFSETCEPKNFVVIKEEEAIEKLAQYVEDLMKGTRPLNNMQEDFVCNYIIEYQYKIQNGASKNLMVRLLLKFRDLYYTRFLSMSDVIKVVDELNYEAYGRKKIKKLNLKNQDRKFITQIINELFLAGKCDIKNCYEKKAIWCGLLHHIHYQPKSDEAKQFVECMRGKENQSVYASFEKAMAENDIKEATAVLKKGKGSGAVLRNLNYILSRCQTEEELQTVISQIETKNTIILHQLLLKYSGYKANKEERRIFSFTKHNLLKEHQETKKEYLSRKSFISEETAKKLCDKIMQNLRSIYQNKLGKVYIDPNMKMVALPLQEGTASGGYGTLAKGTRKFIEQGKKIRAFTYWEKVNDIDLSIIGIREDESQKEFSWRTMADNQSDALTFSGDETSGYNGGSEYFDIDIKEFKKVYPDIQYLVFCNNIFSYSTFKQCICKAGYMLRDNKDSGQIYEPKTVESSFTIDCDSTFAYLFAIDLQKSEFIWLNISKNSNEHIAGESQVSFLKKYFHVTEIMNLEILFQMLATEVVETPEEADVAVTDREIEARNGLEIIRSGDTERIIALMNS